MGLAPASNRAWTLWLAGASVLAVAIVTFALLAQPIGRAHEPLTHRQLATPVFDPPPPAQHVGRTVATLWHDLRGPRGIAFLRRVVPTQSGALWLTLVVALVVGFNTRAPFDWRNLELAGLLVVGFLLFDIMRFFDVLAEPAYFQLMDWVFSAVVAASLALAVRAAWRVWHLPARPWVPGLPTRALVALTLVLLTLNALVCVVQEPDDAGFYTNLGAQRLRERGMFPYGDPLLSGTPGAAYGPVLFLAHLPFQWLLDPAPVNTDTSDNPLAAGEGAYRLPAYQASQLATLAFHLLGVAALVMASRRLAGSQVAWGLAALYCGSAGVLGVGGPPEMVGGITFISHIAAPALALSAFACLASPFAAGALLALSVATVFYPLFFVPAWIGYYWHRRRALLRFVAGMGLAALVVGVPVLLRSRPVGQHGLVATIVRETLGHHQSSAGYGQTTFGFWGQRAGVRGWLQAELSAGQAMSTPMFLLAALLALGAFVPARRASPPQIALLSGALAIVVEVWKILGTGVYVNWYYPFLLIGFFTPGALTAVPDSRRPDEV